jgi:septal ring factor EnvC (AmiA/AmiB activator)
MTALLLAAALAMQIPAAAKDKNKAKDEKTHHTKMSIWSYSNNQGDFSFILVNQGGEGLSGSGDRTDFVEAGRLGKTSDSDLLWARLDDNTYVIRDQATVEKARKAMEPVKALSGQQSALGDQQSKLGDQQSALGDKQSALGDQQSDLGDRQARISEKIADRQAKGSPIDDLERELDKIEQQQEDLQRQQDALQRQQDALQRQQEPLQRQQEALGAQCDKLSRKMNDDIEALVREAVKSGLAVRQI